MRLAVVVEVAVGTSDLWRVSECVLAEKKKEMECTGGCGEPAGCVLSGSRGRRCLWGCTSGWLGSGAPLAGAAVVAGANSVASKVVATARP